MTDPVVIVDYDPDWPGRFVTLRDQLAAALGPIALRIDHVGSTAVPGLAAKPVIDIQIGVADPDDAVGYREPLESLGLRVHHQEPGWKVFRPAGARICHVHVLRVGSAHDREHRLFAAYLRADSKRREAYAALKRDLADRFGQDRDGYTLAKTLFVTGTLALAEAWAAETGWE
jgi:GrpB-like predicted nucleotidyltransferase (UPF0157 family)